MNHLQQLLDKIFFLSQAEKLALMLRREHRMTVFTNGCFDILHRGHVEYLSRAADMGERLVIGLNTDSSVSRLKGPGRPINDESARAMVLAALSFVDAVVLFDEDTPYELITLLRPDVLVKGSDYSMDQIVGADIVLAGGGRVETLDFIPGYSTTAIEERIRSSRQ